MLSPPRHYNMNIHIEPYSKDHEPFYAKIKEQASGGYHSDREPALSKAAYIAFAYKESAC